MKVLSLFDGISCARVALKRAGFKVDKYYASETDKYAIQIAQKNYPDTIQLGDVTQIRTGTFRKIDLLIGGSPCQDLSIAKKDRKGLKGERSGLFWEYVRILKEVKPKYFILENVASMSKDNRDTISKALGVEPVMINAALVSAQQRKRLFWTNIKGVEQPKDKEIYLKDILEDKSNFSFSLYNLKTTEGKATTLGSNSQCITAKTGQGICNKPIRVGKIGKGGQGDRIYSPKGKSVSLSANGGGRGAKTGLYFINQNKMVSVRKYKVDVEALKKVLRKNKTLTNKEIAEKTKQPMTLVEHWFRKDSSFSIPDKNIWLKLKKILSIETNRFDKSILEFIEKKNVFEQGNRVYCGNKAPTLQTGKSQDFAISKSIVRKLTPVECERLQCVPDNYTALGINTEDEKIDISNTQRYKCCGNAFNVDVVAHILKYIK